MVSANGNRDSSSNINYSILMHWKITNGATFHRRLLHLNWISNCNLQLCVCCACVCIWCFIFHFQCQIIQFLFSSSSLALFHNLFGKWMKRKNETQTRNSISSFSSMHVDHTMHLVWRKVGHVDGWSERRQRVHAKWQSTAVNTRWRMVVCFLSSWSAHANGISAHQTGCLLLVPVLHKLSV